MLKLLKRLLPAEPLPAHVHFHIDERGHRVLCDESICQPRTQPVTSLFLPHQ